MKVLYTYWRKPYRCTGHWTVGGKLCYHRNKITQNYILVLRTVLLAAQRPVSLRLGRVHSPPPMLLRLQRYSTKEHILN